MAAGSEDDGGAGRTLGGVNEDSPREVVVASHGSEGLAIGDVRKGSSREGAMVPHGGAGWTIGGASNDSSREGATVPHGGADGHRSEAGPATVSSCPAEPGHGSLKAVRELQQDEAYSAEQGRTPEASSQAAAARKGGQMTKAAVLN